MFDKEAQVIGMTSFDIIKSLTLDDVENFLISLGVEKIQKYGNYLILPTICHNSLEDAVNMKLYYYDNYKCFHCYTECNESMSIVDLYMKFMSINYYDITKNAAYEYIKKFITHSTISSPNEKKNIYLFDEDRYKYHSNIITLPEISPFILDTFNKFYAPQWLAEGITKESMNKYNIRWSIEQNKVIIPHYDINGRLIGLRGRAFNNEEIKEFGKYHPVVVGDKIYSHPLSYNLYGLNKNKDTIMKYRKVILVEGEKSVLLGDKYFGEDNICAAVCGSHINKYQIALLTNLLNVNEIIVAFDKDFEYNDTEGAVKCRKRIREQCEKYKNEANFFYIFDEHNLLNFHDSPLDRGYETWNKLYKERIRIL